MEYQIYFTLSDQLIRHNPWSMKLFFDQFRFFVYTLYCQKQYYILFSFLQKPHSVVWYPLLYIVVYDIYPRYLFTLFNRKWWPIKYYLVLSYLMLNIPIKFLLNIKNFEEGSLWIVYILNIRNIYLVIFR